jgi:hypothetical protein
MRKNNVMNRKTGFWTVCMLAIPLLASAGQFALADEAGTLSLAGTWKFRLDAGDVGVKEKWFARMFEDTVQLPGTTDENHKGIRKDEQAIDRLSRENATAWVNGRPNRPGRGYEMRREPRGMRAHHTPGGSLVSAGRLQ